MEYKKRWKEGGRQRTKGGRNEDSMGKKYGGLRGGRQQGGEKKVCRSRRGRRDETE